ncbi:hypothetical protein [Nonomuraea sp. GTA35]|uniref:hypothetical protein n=1 Tax=Nonomuraea sp. GTA35 TaxID=1676746 RepID=UPI0035C0BEB6
MIVTVTKAARDGSVVRWHTCLAAAETFRPVMTADRHGVRVNAYLHEIPAEALRAAEQAYETLRRDREADVSHLATHVHRGPSNGPLVPVEEADRG